MAAPHKHAGNKSDKPWRHALQKAVKEWYTVDIDGKPQKIRALNAMARKAVERGMNGDATLIREIGDRLDGKPAQAVDVGVKVQITAIERTIIAPKAIEAPVIEGQAVEVSQAIESNGETISGGKE